VSAARDLLDRYGADPAAFFREVLRFEPWSRQAAIAESVRDHSRTAVRSCHGAGKTATAARVALWFLAVHPSSRVVTTAPTWAQVRDLLWREIRLAYQAAGGFIGGELFDTRLELATDWLALGISTDRPERFQGHHAEHLLLVVDEASGVDEAIFEASAGFLTSPGARLLLIGNPTRTSGEFFDAFHSARGFYNTVHISAFDTPAFSGERVPREVAKRLVSRKWVEDHARKWGEGSPLWQVRIAAEFPSQSDDALVALGDLEAAQARELEPGAELVVACDVARFGNDQTVLAVRRGNVVRVAKVYGGRDTMRTVGEIMQLARNLRSEHGRRPVLVVDDAGLGGGVTDRLRELGEFHVVAYNGAKAAARPAEYPNRRSEDWFALAELLPQLDLDRDEELAADLLAPRYSLDSQARRVVEVKAETKRRLRRSPDRGDAVVMAFAVERPGRRSQGRISRPRGRIPGVGIPRGRLGGYGRDPLAEFAQRVGVPVFDSHAGAAELASYTSPRVSAPADPPAHLELPVHDAGAELRGYLDGRLPSQQEEPR
jgi:phage terminase large subunit